MERNRSRSRSGCRGLRASSSTRRLKASHDNSRLSKRLGAAEGDRLSAGNGRPPPSETTASRVTLVFAMAGLSRNFVTKLDNIRESVSLRLNEVSQDFPDQGRRNCAVFRQGLGIRPGDKRPD